jgi:F0F1-type ATP synthase membrane subunit b/b'
MEATLQALGQLLLKAVPTVVLLLFVHFYLKAMLFRPLEAALGKRREVTEGARAAAEQLLAKASERAAAIEQKLREAREKIYSEQEETRKRWVAEQTASIDAAREASHAKLHEAQERLAAETEAAKRDLAGTADALAEEITRTLLERIPA